MKTILLASLVAVLLSGCENPSSRQVSYPIIPEELRDCKFFKITPGNLEATFTVVRCPNSATTVIQKSGKQILNTIVIDGQEYVKKNNDTQ